MPFKNVPGIPGVLYVPAKLEGGEKKHNCRDCFSCQFCPDSRCRSCLAVKKKAKKNPGTGKAYLFRSLNKMLY